MYYIPELGPNSAAYGEPRIFFTMEYVVPDRAFTRAAENWRHNAPLLAGFNPTQDEVLSFDVPTEKDFRRVWALVAEACRIREAKAFFGAVFSHASKDSPRQDGLEFRPGASDDGTIARGEIASMDVLPWHPEGALVLMGCNTGNLGTRGWCPASAFAARQKVRTLGQTGYSYFSKRWSSYDESSPADRNICLWAYKRGKNSTLGNGSRMPGRVYT